MKLDLDRQRLGRSHLDVAERLGLDVEAPLPAEVELRGRLTVDNLESRMVVLGTLAATAAAVCDRCLEDFVCEFEAGIEIVVLRDTATDEVSDPWVIHQRRGEVDLTESLRQAALLGMPQKMLCAAECRGLCPHCGVNRNREACPCAEQAGDPRWDDLPEP